MIYELDGVRPQIDPTAWVAPTAVLIGNVIVGPRANIWFGAVLRGDNEPIVVGEGSNIQENSVLHTDMGSPLTIGANCTIGHKVMLHGCTIADGSLIGMGATLLNGAKIGKNCLVGAGSLVTEGKEFPDGSMIMGTPAKVVRELSPEQIEGLRQSARHYVENAQRFKAGLKKIG